MAVLWSRRLDHFNLNLEWRGDNRVFLTAEGDGDIDEFSTDNGSSDPAAIGRLMKRVEEELHDTAVALA
ncbi:MAG: hypothetical protein ACWGQW_01630 [bacterium]